MYKRKSKRTFYFVCQLGVVRDKLLISQCLKSIHTLLPLGGCEIVIGNSVLYPRQNAIPPSTRRERARKSIRILRISFKTNLLSQEGFWILIPTDDVWSCCCSGYYETMVSSDVSGLMCFAVAPLDFAKGFSVLPRGAMYLCHVYFHGYSRTSTFVQKISATSVAVH